jgi:peptidoglycan/xylan/chitin deacetylase (PgdA/CDA1 family)
MARFVKIILLFITAVISGGVCLVPASQAAAVDSASVQNRKYVVVTASGNETLESLAQQYYGDGKKSWIISGFNNTASVTRGDVLIIPPENIRPGGIQGNGYQTVPVLAYHRFSPDSSDRMIIKRSDFDSQMAYLKEAGYHCLTSGEFHDFLNYRKQIPEKSVLITLDDGWKSAFDIAVPILQKYGFTATWFLYTDFIGGSKAISWAQVKQLDNMGFDIQVQSKAHTNLGIQLEDESMKEYLNRLDTEIRQSRILIEKKIGKPCRYMAYPYGATNGIVTAMLKKYGYHGAFTVNRGANPFFVNHYAVHRSLIYGGDDLNRFKKSLKIFKRLNLK